MTKDKDGGVLFLRRFRKGTGNFYPAYNSEVCCDLSSFDDYKGSQTVFGHGDAINDRTQFGIFGLFNNQDDECYEDNYHINEELCQEIDDDYRKMAKIYTRKDGNREVTNELTLMRDKSFKFIDKRDMKWTLGEGRILIILIIYIIFIKTSLLISFIGELDQIPKGVEMAIESMLIGEKAMFMIRYDYLKEMLTDEEYKRYKKNSEFYIFIITLKSCTQAKEYYEMDRDERLKVGLECKLKGKSNTNLFIRFFHQKYSSFDLFSSLSSQKGNYYLTERPNVKLALKRFRRAIDLLETSIDLDGENSERDALLFNCYLNISKAYFDAKTPELCEEFLNKALSMKPNNEKAMYRNGLLLMKRKKYEEAKIQFENLLIHFPTNKAAIKLIDECKRKALEQSSVEYKLYKKMGKLFAN